MGAMLQKMRPVAVGIVLALFGASLTLALPGCSIVYSYELEGAIRALPDGRPLQGVHLDLKAEGIYFWPEPVVTAKDGTLVAKFNVSAQQFSPEGTLPKWRLLLTKDGYHDESIDISPRRAPKSRGQITELTVVAYMRPKTP